MLEGVKFAKSCAFGTYNYAEERAKYYFTDVELLVRERKPIGIYRPTCGGEPSLAPRSKIL